MSNDHYARFTAGIVDVLAPLGAVSQRRFFGGQGLVCDGVQFAMVIRGALYLRVDAALAATMIERGAQPFEYGTRKRTVSVASYYSVPEDVLDEAEILMSWARQSIALARQRGRPHAKRTRARG
ncbi:MAG TPA: TfoX/Sxy family protein [Rudaea sp.]|nr:TfoX/Sxy family protein [Rudaea sp.]